MHLHQVPACFVHAQPLPLCSSASALPLSLTNPCYIPNLAKWPPPSPLPAHRRPLLPQLQNAPTLGVLELQRRYARVPSSPLTTAFTDQVVVSTALPPPAGPVQVAVTLDIVQAPSAFALPVMQKRPWDPPFQVGATSGAPAGEHRLKGSSERSRIEGCRTCAMHPTTVLGASWAGHALGKRCAAW